MQKTKISCIYLDMDGVIADFEKRYEELFGMKPAEAEKKEKFYHLFDEFIEDNNFASFMLYSFTLILGGVAPVNNACANALIFAFSAVICLILIFISNKSP